MKKFAIWFIVLAVCETIAIFVGQSLSSDAAAVLAGGFIGLVGALVAALVTSMVIEDRRYRELQRLSRQSRRRPEGLPWRQDVLEGEWREVGNGFGERIERIAEPERPRQVEAPERALVKR